MNYSCNFLVSCTITQQRPKMQFWNVCDWHSDCTVVLFDSRSVIREIRWDLTEVCRGLQFWSTLISGRPFMFWLDAAVGKNLSHVITIYLYCANFFTFAFFTFHAFTNQQNKTMKGLVSLTQQAKTTHTLTHHQSPVWLCVFVYVCSFSSIIYCHASCFLIVLIYIIILISNHIKMSIPKFKVKQSINKCAWCLLPILNKQETERNRTDTVFHSWNTSPYKALKRRI